MYERRSSPGLWVIFTICALAGTALFFIPAYVIRPFSYQAPRALVVAMALRTHAPLWTIIAALLCLLFAFELWRTSNWWRRIIVVIAMIPLLFATVMARLNYFEWMFHPVDSAPFETQASSKLDPAEMVLTVHFGSDARAYPISEMAYHHVLNDWVGGVPVAVTY
jgi:Protein of unknown function (DUF3179)